MRTNPAGEDIRSRGVTLLEMLVVAALASIMLALVFPSVRAGMGTLELRSSAQHLAAAAKYARDQAIYRQRPFDLEVDRRAGSIAVIDSFGPVRSFELPSSVRIASIVPEDAAAADEVRHFVFAPDGAADPFEIVLDNSRRRMTVSTDPLTGFPRVSER